MFLSVEPLCQFISQLSPLGGRKMWLIKLIQIKLWYRQSKHLETSKTAERSEFTYLNLKKKPEQ